MGIILKVDGTEIKKDSKALIACILLREIMTGIWVEKISKGNFEHKVGTYQIVRPTRGNKKKVIKAIENIVNGCSGLERNIAYMEINSIWNGKKCGEETKAIAEHIARLNVDEMRSLSTLKEKTRVCVDLIDGISESKGVTKYFKLAVATFKFIKCAKKFSKIAKIMFKKSGLAVELELSYNLKANAVEMEVTTTNTVISAQEVNA